MQVEPVGSIIEYAQAMRHFRPSPTYTDIEAKFAEPISDQVFDQQYLLAGLQNAFYLSSPTIPLRLFADVNHRLFDDMGHKGSIGNAGRLASGDDVDFVHTYIGLNHSRQCGNDVFTLGRE